MSDPYECRPGTQYHSYLLRLWMEDQRNESSSRIVIVNPQTGDRRGFVDFDQFVEFLKDVLVKESEST